MKPRNAIILMYDLGLLMNEIAGLIMFIVFHTFTKVKMMINIIAFFIYVHNIIVRFMIMISECKTNYETGYTLRNNLKVFLLLPGLFSHIFFVINYSGSGGCLILYELVFSIYIIESEGNNESKDEQIYTHLIYPEIRPEVAPQIQPEMQSDSEV